MTKGHLAALGCTDSLPKQTFSLLGLGVANPILRSYSHGASFALANKYLTFSLSDAQNPRVGTSIAGEVE